ncbi:MAG TPA: MiaB/RimO family radical SAM methylthiotransferase [Thermoleophilia bacterium]|nr:MiaB/RimO family radical SAM methylthiotransferase [Thermoleophilia bacterium]
MIGASFAIVTLGCPKNEADSDRLEAALRGAGHRPAPLSSADLVLVNTCGFIDAAKQESIDALLDACELAHERGARVAAYGCLVARHADELRTELPEVDLFSPFDLMPILELLERVGPTSAEGGEEPAGAAVAGAVARRPRPVHSYLKISDGCDRRCTYCAIPLIKGTYEAVPPRQILRHAEAALERGARELVLVGQDTSRWQAAGYGGLGRLLGDLRGLGATWLRLLYLQPDGVSDALLEALAASAVPYLDLPLQHASRRILRAMGRRGDGQAYLELLDRVRSVLPDVALRSTFIAGFPGETEADVDELIDFIEAAAMAVAGVFPFDPQEGTIAAGLPGQVPEHVRSERAARVGDAVARAADAYWRGFVGREVEVLLERGSRGAAPEAVGRIAQQAPDVDGTTVVNGAVGRRGQVVRALVDGVAGYHLLARAVT